MVEGRRAAVLLAVVAALAAAVYLVPDLLFGDDSGGERAPAHGCRHARDRPSRDLRAAELATLCLLNAERRARGRRPLRRDPRLRVAALRQSRDMVSRHFLEHVNPDGVGHHERILAAGYRPAALGGSTGENLATGRSDAGTPAVVVDGWMHSPGHRRNVLRREFVEIGIGIVPRDTSGGDGATYATELAAPPRR
ncbi:MAG TPA: CAP domain-containing protein [Thermoleophilaceae bacterium]|jgi:uncharacterized protein YkwD